MKYNNRMYIRGGIGVADYAITPKNIANYAITPKNIANYAITQKNRQITPPKKSPKMALIFGQTFLISIKNHHQKVNNIESNRNVQYQINHSRAISQKPETRKKKHDYGPLRSTLYFLITSLRKKNNDELRDYARKMA